MQKHQQWLDNRTYEQHLMCLTKIKQNGRKTMIKSAAHNRRRQVSQKHDSFDHNVAQDGSPSIKGNKVSKITSKDKELLWNNFLIGKRIMETIPVINVKKQQDEYKKHKRILDWRIERSKKLATNTGFRDTKLKQFTIKTHRLANCHRLETAARSRYILCLKITNLAIHRPCHMLEDLIIKMRSQGKKTVQSSEIVNVVGLSVHEFFFKYFVHKDASVQGNCILIEIYELKGLQQRHIGGFSIQRENIGTEKTCLTAEMRKNGKGIGQISYEVFIMKRNIFKQTL